MLTRELTKRPNPLTHTALRYLRPKVTNLDAVWTQHGLIWLSNTNTATSTCYVISGSTLLGVVVHQRERPILGRRKTTVLR
ncbi:MAG: hypothetical protein CMJ64_30380 [Planctomycetaceae bacterium]|nr:hypothetical protein [Planctomycetaceae bacterium]